MYCSKCGTAVADGAAFCGTCGQPMSASQPGIPAASGGAAPIYSGTAAPGVPPAAPIVSIYAPPVAGAAYAGFWLRFIAAIIDGLILGIPIVFIAVFIAAGMGISGAFQNIRPGDNPGAVFALLGVGFILAVVAVSIVGGWLYYSLMESSSLQGTLGKKALGLYVTDLEGRRVTFGRACGRYLGGRFLGHVPGFGGLYFIVDCICVGFTDRKQALHDMIASCLVLRKI
jgi:uncharacterized RDD family membrane protein YckC